MRARVKKRERNRRLLIVTILVAVVAVVVIGAYALSTLQPPGQQLVGAPVSSSVYHALYAVAQTSYGNSNSSLVSQLKSFSGQPFSSGGKPIVVYIGADYCPYCAFQRWAIIVALMRFGNFTNLHYMLSSSTDVFANSPTFTFYQSTYSSKYVIFQSYEQQDRNQNPLQTVPSNYTAVFSQFGSSYPFLDIGNQYVVSGAFEYPTLLDGKNWTQIAQQLGSSNPLSNEVVDSANIITAAICKLTGGAPSSVCGNSNISALSVGLVAYRQPSSTSFAMGTTSAIPNTWARVQYGQIAWMTNSSVKMRYPANTTAIAHNGISA
jgi:thiol-disulfide isomerase/thioredoxin